MAAFLAKQKNRGKFFGLSAIDKFNAIAPAHVRTYDLSLPIPLLMHGILPRASHECGLGHVVNRSLPILHINSCDIFFQASLSGTP
jgi:hypothetical protein